MEITRYSTYGYKRNGAWKIPIRLWLHTNRRCFGHPITQLIRDHSVNFEDRITDLIADNERGKKVSLNFDADPAAKSYSVGR